jgi:hypothetical protein
MRHERSAGSVDELPSGTGIAQPDGVAAATCVATDGNGCSADAAQAPPGSTVGAPALCLPEHDLLAEAMCAGDGPPAWVVSFDPMLEELLAPAFVVSYSVEAAPPGFAELPPMAAVLLPQPSAQELTQLTPPRAGHPDVEFGDVAVPPGFAEPPPVAAAPSPQPSAQDLALLTPPRMGQPDVEIGDETPTPREAARRLARFVDEVRVVREPPLFASPPRQRARARRPLPVRRRSTRIAAQPLAHIPASRRGAPRATVGDCAVGRYGFTCAQGDTRRLAF